MARYAYVAVIQTLDPVPPQKWGVTGDVAGISSEDQAQAAVVRELAQRQEIHQENLLVVAFSAFEITYPPQN